MRAAAAVVLAVLSGCAGEIALPKSVAAPPDAMVDCTATPLPERRIRRLTRSELDAAASFALGQPVALSAQLSPDVFVEGFDTSSNALDVNGLFAQQLAEAAHGAAQTVQANPQPFGNCNDSSDSCRDAFIAAFGARAFRRPLSAVEAADFANLYALAKADGHPVAAALVAEAMLQSPGFLYRTELGSLGAAGEWTLTQNELAQAIAFLATGGPPDAELGQANLLDADVRAAQVQRLSASAAGTEQLGNFAEEWLGLAPLSFIAKSGDTGQGFTQPVRDAMRAEARSFHASRFRAGGFGALFSGSAAADPALTAFYGSGERDGVLTLGAFLSVYGKADASAPVQRGKAVRNRLLCQDLAPPPPNVNAMPPAPVPGTTARQRYATHESNPSCAGCHRQIDLIGFGLEHYDGAGRFRADEAGVAIDASGQVLGLDGADASFDGAGGLAGLLSQSKQARGCYARQWVRFGLGSDPSKDSFSCLSRQLEASFAATDAPLSQVLDSLVRADGFIKRHGPATAVAPPDDLPVTFTPPATDGGTGTTMGGLTVNRTPNSDWATGFCEDVTVTNATAASLDWQVTLQVNGTVTQSWNSSYTAGAQGVTFMGAAWNMTLSSGASASFGYCADK